MRNYYLSAHIEPTDEVKCANVPMAIRIGSITLFFEESNDGLLTVQKIMVELSKINNNFVDIQQQEDLTNAKHTENTKDDGSAKKPDTLN